MIKLTMTLLLMTTLSCIAMDNQQQNVEPLAQDILTLLTQNYCDIKTTGKLLLTNRQQNNQFPEICRESLAFSWAAQKSYTCSLKKALTLKEKLFRSPPRLWQFKRAVLVKISPNKEFVAIGPSDDTTIDLWETKTGRLITTFSGHSSGIPAIIITSDNNSIISASHDGTIKIWDMQTKTCSHTYAPGNEIIGIKTNDRYIVSVSLLRNWGKIVTVWDMNTNLEILSKQLNLYSLDLIQSTIATISYNDKKLSLYDISLNELNSINFVDRPTSLAISSDEKYIYVGFINGKLKIIDAQTLEDRTTLQPHSSAICHIALCKNHELIITSSYHSVKITHTKTGLCLREFKRDADVTNSVDISDDGKLIITGSVDGSAKLWTCNPEIIGNSEIQKPAKSSYCPCTII